MPSSREYQAQYWKANRQRLLASRKERYLKDAKYREAALVRSRTRVGLNRILRVAKPKTLLHNGVSEPLRTFSDLRAAADRSKHVLYRWRGAGVLPLPLYHDKRGNGIYAESQILFVKDLTNRIDHQDLHITYEEMGRVLADVWKQNYSPGRLSQAITACAAAPAHYWIIENTEEKASGKTSRKESRRSPSSAVGSRGRCSKSKNRKGAQVHRGACDGSCKHGHHVEHGELPESSTRRGSRSTLRSRQGRRSV